VKSVLGVGISAPVVHPFCNREEALSSANVVARTADTLKLYNTRTIATIKDDESKKK
jgi:hypothetical protein